MALKLKESDALKSAAPKRSLKVPCLSEKAKALNLRKEEESQAGVAHIYGRQASFVCEMVKKEKELVQILLPHFKSINSSAPSILHSPTLTSIHDHWENHSLD